MDGPELLGPEQEQEGQIEAINLEALHWDDDEGSFEEPVPVQQLLEQLEQANAAGDHATLQFVLEQLCSTSLPPYVILNCDAWPKLVTLLPALLSSSHAGVAAAAQQLLLDQLGPELLQCSPEPVAQLLVALISAAEQGDPSSNVLLQQQVSPPPPSSPPPPQPAAGVELPAGQLQQQPQPLSPQQQQQDDSWPGQRHGLAMHLLPEPVLQLMNRGLQALGRQWHFLDLDLAQQLCEVLVGMMMTPLRQLLLAEQPHHQQQQQGQQQQRDTLASEVRYAQVTPQQHQQQHEQQQQQQQQQQRLPPLPLAVQLLLCDPHLGWWHRLVAASGSAQQLKAAAAQQGLVALLVGCLQAQKQLQLHPCGQPQQLGTETAPPPGHCLSSGCGGSSGVAVQQVNTPLSAAAAAAGAAGAASAAALGVSAVGGSAAAAGPEAADLLLLSCLAVHILASLFGTHSGRQLLEACRTGAQTLSTDGREAGPAGSSKPVRQTVHAGSSATQSLAGHTISSKPATCSHQDQSLSAATPEAILEAAAAWLSSWAASYAITHPVNAAAAASAGGGSSAAEQPGGPCADVGWSTKAAAEPDADASGPMLDVGGTGRGSLPHAPEVLMGAPPQAAGRERRRETQLCSVAAGTLVAAAAAAASWALQAREEQRPWFEGC